MEFGKIVEGACFRKKTMSMLDMFSLAYQLVSPMEMSNG